MLSLTVAATMIKGDANPGVFNQQPRPSVVRRSPIDELAEGYRPERAQLAQDLDRLPPGDPTMVFAKLFDPSRRTMRSLFVLDDGSRRRRPGQDDEVPTAAATPIEERRTQDRERFAKLNEDAREDVEERRDDERRSRLIPNFNADRLVIARLSPARESGPAFSVDAWSSRAGNPLSERLSGLRRGHVPGVMYTDQMIGRDEIRRPGLDSGLRLRSESETLRAGDLDRFATGALGSDRRYQSDLRRFDYDRETGFQRRSMGYSSPYGTGRAGAGSSPSMGYRRLGSPER